MKKILIIEDEIPMAKVMEIKLQKMGFDAKAVFGGEEGLKELESGGYDLVLLDLMMPGVDGWSILAKIKENGIQTKVVVTSNLSQEEDKKKAMEMGAVDFLIKSDISLSEMVAKVKSYLT